VLVSWMTTAIALASILSVLPFAPPSDLRLVPLGLTAARMGPNVPESRDIYAPMIGDWKILSVTYATNGVKHRTNGHWSFRWVLHGSAIQDVIGADVVAKNGTFIGGTTVRFYDRADGSWRVTYVEPISNTVVLLSARQVGSSIVQTVIGGFRVGDMETWTFDKITPDSYHWIDRVWQHGSWRTEQEIFATRVDREF
jgi:uncharacterized protein